ncbi:Piso0_002472 [Millerozyma farinosa CBS 7064]|uniref:Mediator of RNA polymerase II transcription subunit 19 n=1 Tax=Pichia sorbitophila (strain ATCC MYA-4447 / BCRC 22081 / CBS 7064 / NBRC 10061 / NRRL Y-12695) TaxID=559304 RepID=G8YCP9_PICSO|nr:Piso0_002472 [Millerozyma farinosa CBS 7064]
MFYYNLNSLYMGLNYNAIFFMGADSYLIDTEKKYKLVDPSPLENLIALYGLEDVTKSLSRINPDGSKGVKLRKSYKNHIQDISGKHQIPPPKPIPMSLLDPGLSQMPDTIQQLSPDLLHKALKFEKTPANGIPGFNIVDLAMNDQHTLMRGDDAVDNEDASLRKGKRKKKSQNYPDDIKRIHT